jgi:hypothetical protein
VTESASNWHLRVFSRFISLSGQHRRRYAFDAYAVFGGLPCCPQVALGLHGQPMAVGGAQGFGESQVHVCRNSRVALHDARQHGSVDVDVCCKGGHAHAQVFKPA